MPTRKSGSSLHEPKGKRRFNYPRGQNPFDTPSANRKQVLVDQMIQVPDEPTAYPWGRAPEEEEA